MEQKHIDELEASLQNDKPVVIKMDKVKWLFETEIISKAYIFMFFALMLSALTSSFISEELVKDLYKGFYFTIPIIAQLIVFFAGRFMLNREYTIGIVILFIVHSCLMGINFIVISFGLANRVITFTFIITAVLYLIMAIYAYGTDTNMTSVRSIMIMCSFGLAITLMVNLFILKSGRGYTFANCVGVLILIGLTAHGVQSIKKRLENTKKDKVFILALHGGFEIYIDFFNSIINVIYKVLCATAEFEDWANEGVTEQGIYDHDEVDFYALNDFYENNHINDRDDDSYFN
jgi:FtsH-binding integral membrane protein